MNTLYSVLIAVHVLCWIGALVLIDPISSTIRKGAAHATAAALVTGLILVGIGEAGNVHEFNHYKIAIKLTVALLATVLAFVAQRSQGPTPLARALFGLVSLNILIAILW